MSGSELVTGVTLEHGRLPNCTIPHQDALEREWDHALSEAARRGPGEASLACYGGGSLPLLSGEAPFPVESG